MKKMISAVLAGAVILSLSACTSNTETVDTTEAAKEVQAVTETTQEETVASSSENTESEQSETDLTENETNTETGKILVDYTGMSVEDIAGNILKASKIKAGETIGSYSARFSITPEVSFEGNLCTLTWPEDKLTLFSIRQVQIMTNGGDNGIDEDCDVVVIAWFDDDVLCTDVSDYIRDHSDPENAKRPSSYSFFEADGIYQYTIETPVIVE